VYAPSWTENVSPIAVSLIETTASLYSGTATDALGDAVAAAAERGRDDLSGGDRGAAVVDVEVVVPGRVGDSGEDIVERGESVGLEGGQPVEGGVVLERLLSPRAHGWRVHGRHRV